MHIKHISIYRSAIIGCTAIISGGIASAYDYPDVEQEYVWDYFTPVNVSQYLDSYHGTSYKANKISASGTTVVQAEDFDKGGKGIAFNYKENKSNTYRNDSDSKVVSVNSGNGGYVVGNISGGDWFCYTIEVEEDGEYDLSTQVSCDVNRSYHFEVDGTPVVKTISFQGMGWGSYLTHSLPGLQLKAGKHVVKFVPGGAMNIDCFSFTRKGAYNSAAAGTPQFTYPRYGVYTGNPLFTDFTSPMFGNPFVGKLWTADPSAHVFKDENGNDRLYVYASHDMEPAIGCDRMDRYHIFSTSDLVNWTDHGEIMNSATSNKYTGTTGDGFMWAPDCAYNPNDGLYYFVYPHKIDVNPDAKPGDDVYIEDIQNPASNKRWAHFLAVSKTPAGPFQCIGYIKGIPSTIDPCIFVDEVGEAYIFTSGQGHGGWGAKLKRDNWLELATEMKPLVGEDGTEKGGFDDFHEAPYMIKRNGVYYLLHSDNNSANNRLRYSTAKNPLGPFTKGGIFMNPHGHDTHHNSLVEFKGKWYSFYHTGDYSAAGNLRSVCFDEVEFGDNGELKLVNTWGKPYNNILPVISMVEPTTIKVGEYNEGRNGNAYFKRDHELQRAEGIELDNEEWLRYSVNVKDAGRYAFAINGTVVSGKPKVAISCNGEWRTSSDGKEFTGDELYIFPINLSQGEQYIELRVKNGVLRLGDFVIGMGQVDVPGTIEAEDLDATDYKFQQTSSVNHSYRDDVDVAFGSSNGVTRIGNTSAGDWFTYTFNVPEDQEGTYAVTSYVSTGSGEGKYTLTFDKDTPDEVSYEETFEALIPDGKSNGWDTYQGISTKKITLTKGIHKMRFTVNRGLNVDRFVFERTGDFIKEISDEMVNGKEIPGTFNAGDLDKDDFYHKSTQKRNEYRDDLGDVVRITKDGSIGNTDNGNFYTYYFSAAETAPYNVSAYLSYEKGKSSKFKIIFNDENEHEASFIGAEKGWNDQVEVPLDNPVELEGGYHKMQFHVQGGMNIHKFVFSRADNDPSTGIEMISAEDYEKLVNVYTIDGRIVKAKVKACNALSGLDRGIYIIDGKKFLK